jgi:hypothetical protein
LGQFLCPSSGVFHCSFGTGICNAVSMTAFMYDLVVHESCHQKCMTYASAECTVENSWWWTEEMLQTRRVSWQNEFGKLVRLLVFIKKKFVTMYGHMNVKKGLRQFPDKFQEFATCMK